MWNEQLVFSLDGGGTVTVTNANIWQGGLAIEQSVSSDGFFEIGSTHVGQMTVTLVDTFDDIDFQNATVVVSMAKDSDTLQQMGVYTVVRSERDNGILGITAYDNMHLLSEPYTTSLSFPSTYGAMANEIVGTTIQFDGSTTAVSSAPEFEPETTKREVLGYIAQACGYNVKCNSSGYIEFVRYNMSGFNTSGAYHEISSLFDFHHSYYPVVITGAKVIVRTIVSTTDSDTGETTTEEVVSTYTSGTDDYQIVIEGNPLITTANGQLVANTIFATFGGVGFYTGAVSHISDLSIKASDIMKVTDRTNTTYPMLVSSTQISTGSPQLSQSFAEEPASKLSVQPSIIDRVQTSVRQALLDAKNAQNKGNYAETVANEGKAIAEATNQYFWYDDEGAHVTTTPQETDPTGTTGFNTLWNALGLLLRNGEAILAQFAQSAVSFYDGNGNEAENVTASFGKTGAFIGGVGGNRLEVNGIGMTGYDTDGSKAFNIQFANANNTAEIVEKTPVILRDYPGFFQPLTITPNATPADQTEMSYAITVVIKNSSNQSRSVVLSNTRDYDESDSTEHNVTQNVSVPVYGSRYTLSWKMSYTGSSKSTTFTQWDLDGYNGRIVSVQIDHYLTALTSDVPSYTFGTRSNDPLDNGAYSFTAGEGLIASPDDQTVVGKYNVEDTNGDHLLIVGNGTGGSNRSNAFTVGANGDIEASGAVKANAVQSYTPTWATNQSPANYHCVVSAGLCSFFYQGLGGTHNSETLLGTLPTGAKPKSIVFCPCVKGANAYGLIRVETNGNIYLAYISSTSATARLYFNCSFPVV